MKIKEMAKDILWVFSANLIWCIIILLFLTNVLGLQVVDAGNFFMPLLFTTVEMNVCAVFLFACILAPLWEEYAFRLFPLDIARGVERATQSNLVRPMVVFSSIIFGLCHGSVINILIQGVGGLFLSYLYLKHGYWVSVISHAVWNCMVIFALAFQ